MSLTLFLIENFDEDNKIIINSEKFPKINKRTIFIIKYPYENNQLDLEMFEKIKIFYIDFVVYIIN